MTSHSLSQQSRSPRRASPQGRHRDPTAEVHPDEAGSVRGACGWTGRGETQGSGGGSSIPGVGHRGVAGEGLLRARDANLEAPVWGRC